MEMTHPQVLITDDDIDFRQSLADALSRRGYGTILASDGLEALKVIEHGNIHLALMDVHMPRLDGLGMLESLRSTAPNLPCILMSARLDPQIVERARELRADNILSKPFSLRVLSDTIRQVLDRFYPC
ncbi:response regulator [Pirellulaceae bacterium SH449]